MNNDHNHHTSEAPPNQKKNRPESRSSARRWEVAAGWLMASPALILLLIFMIIPFIMAFAFAFTNQRLISPNPTEYVGARNFSRLLKLRTLTIDPIVDEVTGKPVLDDEGNLTFPRVRVFTRNNPDFPELDGLQEWKSWVRGDSQFVLLAGDAIFMKSLINTFLFAIIVVPIQGGLALLCF